MQLVDQHRIQATAPRYAASDAAAFASKHLYNKALYATRQAFFQGDSFASSATLYSVIKGEPEYALLPRPPQGGPLGAHAGLRRLGQLPRGTGHL